MKRISKDAIDAAERFLWLHGRLIDRHRFALHFRQGSAEAVLAALRPYQNPDGGFGHGLEPDLRGPTSQPVPVEVALRVLDEIGFADPALVQRACAYLQSITRADGGVPFLLPSVGADPRAPWWETDDDPPGALNPTAALAGLLHKHRVDHPWLGPATAFCWDRIAALTRTSPYDLRAILTFLDHVPDRPRAEAAVARLAPLVVEPGVVVLDPDAGGEVHFPLEFAPEPGAVGRRLFTHEVIATHLDALIDKQQPDGGWPINFPVWTPITGHQWRAWATVEALQCLAAYGRMPSAAGPRGGGSPG